MHVRNTHVHKFTQTNKKLVEQLFYVVITQQFNLPCRVLKVSAIDHSTACYRRTGPLR